MKIPEKKEVASKTIHINPKLHSKVRVQAAKQGITVQQLVESALTDYLTN